VAHGSLVTPSSLLPITVHDEVGISVRDHQLLQGRSLTCLAQITHAQDEIQLKVWQDEEQQGLRQHCGHPVFPHPARLVSSAGARHQAGDASKLARPGLRPEEHAPR